MLDCYLKKVTYEIPSGLFLSFYGDQRLTLIQSMDELDNRWSEIDCKQCFFFNMRGEGIKKTFIDCIPKVFEFVDVFLEE